MWWCCCARMLQFGSWLVLFFMWSLSVIFFFFFFSSRRRHTRLTCDWSSDVCSSDLLQLPVINLITQVLLVDELAYKIKMDPVEFRKKNLRDEVYHRQLERGAREIGWSRRNPVAGIGRGSGRGRGESSGGGGALKKKK